MNQDKKKRENVFMQNENNLIYDTYDITFAEIPGEICLAITIMGCQNRCKGCHSPHLRTTDGKILNKDEIIKIISNYKNYITTVLLLGEGHSKNVLLETVNFINGLGFKTAVYSGRDTYDEELAKAIDYYKVGGYQESKGGLNNPNTNQRLYHKGYDITYLLNNNKEEI